MNKSNFVHAIAALIIQLPFGLAGYAAIGGALAVGVMIGIEWMQQVRMNLEWQNRPWPTKLTLRDILMGLYWTNRDRYGDAGLSLIAVSGAAYGY